MHEKFFVGPFWVVRLILASLFDVHSFLRLPPFAEVEARKLRPRAEPVGLA